MNEGVDLSAIVNTQEVGSDSTSQNFEAASKEECCLRCQEIPSKSQSFVHFFALYNCCVRLSGLDLLQLKDALLDDQSSSTRDPFL